MLGKTCLGCAALPYRHCSDSLAALSIDGGGGGAGAGGRVGGGGGGGVGGRGGADYLDLQRVHSARYLLLHRQMVAPPYQTRSRAGWRGLKAFCLIVHYILLIFLIISSPLLNQCCYSNVTKKR